MLFHCFNDIITYYMLYGLEDKEIEKIRAVISKCEKVEKAVLYGSRSRGNFKPFSDIDITLIGSELQRYDRNSIVLELDDLLLPYEFDISLFNSINNQELKHIISREGIVIYQKETTKLKALSCAHD